jgi:hypothetical protein
MSSARSSVAVSPAGPWRRHPRCKLAGCVQPLPLAEDAVCTAQKQDRMPPVRAAPVKAEMGFSAWPCSSFLSSSHTWELTAATSSDLPCTRHQVCHRTLQSRVGPLATRGATFKGRREGEGSQLFPSLDRKTHLALHAAGQLVKQLRVRGQLLEEGGRHRRQLPQHLPHLFRFLLGFFYFILKHTYMKIQFGTRFVSRVSVDYFLLSPADIDPLHQPVASASATPGDHAAERTHGVTKSGRAHVHCL